MELSNSEQIEAQELLVNRRKRDIIAKLNNLDLDIEELTNLISFYRIAYTNLKLLKEEKINM